MRRLLCALLSLAGGSLLAPAVGRAELWMPALFGDHMVLQAGVHAPVWGRANPVEPITIEIDGHVVRTIADRKGNWKVTLPRLSITGVPTEMTVTGTERRVFRDVLIGDVWLCSGQSNMEFGLGNVVDATKEIAEADHPLIRLFLVPHQAAREPREDIGGKWVVCSPRNIMQGGWNGFSAVGYFFGREIHSSSGHPVGLIGVYWGGTPAEAWTSREALQAKPALQHYTATLEHGPVYKTETSPDGGRPTVLYNGMIAPLVPYGLKGVIWYQGERNGSRTETEAREYALLLPTLIADWRVRWGEPDLPFLYVQLPNFLDSKTGQGQFWPWVRDAQLKTLALPRTGMAVTIDLGWRADGAPDEKPDDDRPVWRLHPRDKFDVGHRLALLARRLVYGENVPAWGPIYRSMTVKAGRVLLTFDHAESGLIVGKSLSVSLRSHALPHLDHLVAFSVAGTDGKFVPAEARIVGNRVEVWHPAITEPTAVRYAWSGDPEPSPNLYNRDGLPASPFATDQDG